MEDIEVFPFPHGLVTVERQTNQSERQTNQSECTLKQAGKWNASATKQPTEKHLQPKHTIRMQASLVAQSMCCMHLVHLTSAANLKINHLREFQR